MMEEFLVINDSKGEVMRCVLCPLCGALIPSMTSGYPGQDSWYKHGDWHMKHDGISL